MNIFMPTMLEIMIAGLATVLFGIFSAFILREKAEDEREESHRSLAGRVGFLAGSAVLLCGILVETFEHHIDVWLVLALLAMIISKFLARMYGERYL